MCNSNYMPNWRKLYIMNTYMLPHFLYGSASFIITTRTIEDLLKNGAYKTFKTIFISMLKKTLNLPRNGNTRPLEDMFI